MTEATFHNVSFVTVRAIVPKRAFLPVWTKFTVTVSILDNGDTYITPFDHRYYFPVSRKRALKAIGALAR